MVEFENGWNIHGYTSTRYNTGNQRVSCITYVEQLWINEWVWLRRIKDNGTSLVFFDHAEQINRLKK